MKAEFDYSRLGPAGQLNYRLFDYNAERSRENFRWRDYGFPMSTNGSPAGQFPVFLINQHRIDNVADAEAYVARIRETERAMREIGAEARAQADKGIVPPKLNFAPVRADARRAIAGAPFGPGADSPLLADFKKKVGALDAPAEVKARLVADATAALAGPFRRAIADMLATLDAIEPKATGNHGAWSLPQRRGLLRLAAARPDHDRPVRRRNPPDRPRRGDADPPRDGGDQGCGSASRARSSNSSGTSRRARSSNIRTPTPGGSNI